MHSGSSQQSLATSDSYRIRINRSRRALKGQVAGFRYPKLYVVGCVWSASSTCGCQSGQKVSRSDKAAIERRIRQPSRETWAAALHISTSCVLTHDLRTRLDLSYSRANRLISTSSLVRRLSDFRRSYEHGMGPALKMPDG